VANKFLLDGFFSVERTWRNICAVRNVSDFKTVTSYRLIGKDQYEQVMPGVALVEPATCGTRISRVSNPFDVACAATCRLATDRQSTAIGSRTGGVASTAVAPQCNPGWVAEPAKRLNLQWMF